MTKATAEQSTSHLQEQLDAQRKLVDVDHFDVTVRELARMTAEGEVNRAPLYQRKFRWTEADESRLVESIFLGLPVPSLFFATNKDGTWEVVDGLQRLSTILHFLADPRVVLETIGKQEPLRLEGLEKLPAFNGHTFESLPTPVRLAFSKRALRVTALSDKSDPNVRFDMFERLNRGGVVLTQQEVRACIFRGPLNDLLRELANTAAFTGLVKLQPQKREDGTREELVLKFFAYLQNRDAFDGGVTRFLNNFMNERGEAFDVSAGRRLFNRVTGELSRVCKGPFLREGYGNTPLNQFEAVLVAAGERIQAGEPVRAPGSGWLNDAELVRTSTKGTNTPSMLNGRIRRAKALLGGAKPIRK